MANLYDYDFGRDNTDIPNVVGHSASYQFDQTDTCTIRILTDEREEWRDRLYGQQIRIVRKSDSFVEFRGDIKEIRLDESDRYNLTLHVRDPTWRLSEIEIKRGNGQLRVPRVITSLPDATSIIDTGGADEPPDDEPVVYTSADCAVMIVPSDVGSFTNETVEDSVTSAGTQTGDYDNLNDLDPDTKVNSYRTDTTEWIQFNGSSANAKATVIGVAYKVLVKGFISASTTSIKLQYRDDDGSTWIDLKEETFNGATSILAYWSPEVEISGFLAINTFLDGSDDWRFRILLTKGASARCDISISSVVIDIYTDNAHTASYFPIDSFANNSTDLTVSADPDNSLTPTTAGVAVGDTYIIGKLNEDILNSIISYNAKYVLPVIRSVDSNFSGYTTKDFVGGVLLDAISYFCDREVAHWYYNHNTNYLEIDKESTILTAGEHEIVAGNVDTFSLEKKTDANVRSVTVWGKTYRREPDEEEVTSVAFTYPDDALNATIAESAVYSLRNLHIDDVSINSKSEAAKLAISVYGIRNTVSPTIKVTTNTREDTWLGERLKLTLDGKVYDTTYPVSGININYNVANNDITQMVTGGWQRTPLITRHGEIIKKIARDVRYLHQGQRGIKAPAKKVVVSDGTVGLSDVTITNLTQEGTGVNNAAQSATGTWSIPSGNWTYADWTRYEGGVIFAADDSDASVSTLTGTDGSNNVEFDGDFSASNGSLAATTLTIGSTVISEVGTSLLSSGGYSVVDDQIKASLTGAIGNSVSFESMDIPLDPSSVGTGATIKGLNIDAVNFDMSNNPNLFGIDITLDNPITSSGTYTALRAVGDGNTVYLVTGDHALHVAAGTAQFDGAVSGISLSEIENTEGDKTFTFANKGIKFAFTGVNPGAYDGMFELEMTGNLQADVMHIHQHTGNVVAGSKLLHLHGSDADLLELEISGQGSVLSIQDTGDSDEELLEFDTTARTMRVGAADGNDDIATSLYGSLSLEGGATITTLGDVAALAASDVKIPTNTTVKEYVDAANMIGAANSAWIPCPMAMTDHQGNSIWRGYAGGYSNIAAAAATFCLATLPLPTNRGGLKLYIKGMRLEVVDSDASDYITSILVRKKNHAGWDAIASIDHDTVHGTGVGQFTNAFGAVDCSARSSVVMEIQVVSATALELEIAMPLLDCYYA